MKRAALLFAGFLLGAPDARAESDFKLSFIASHRTRSSGQSLTTALVTLTVPLQRFGTRPVRGFADPAVEAAAVRLETEPEPPALRLDRRLVLRTLRAALRAQGHGASLRRLRSLSRRARNSALLPELRLRAGRSTDESLRIAPTETDPDRYTRSGASDLWVEGRVTWKLNRLVFASEELRVEQLRQRRREASRSMTLRVVQALVAWQRALVAAEDPTRHPDERLASWLDAMEAELLLDLLTDGWFGAHAGVTLE